MLLDIENDLIDISGSKNVMIQELLSEHTTFRIGGPADYMILPQSEQELARVIKLCQSKNIPYFVMGNGSNLLVSDKGYRGLIIKLYNQFNEIEIVGNEIYAQAGALLTRIANLAAKAGLSGMEPASGIPGTLGGAVVMNAGAYGMEMKDVITRVRLLDKEGRIFELTGADMNFGYRYSICMSKEYIVLGAWLKLESGEEQLIREKMREFKEQRTSKQPLEYPSAGSTFKRPEGHFAGKLIMDAGLRGYNVGDAQVSEKHCGFVINKGKASCKDVMELIEHVQKVVLEKYQVGLEMEIRKVGEM